MMMDTCPHGAGMMILGEGVENVCPDCKTQIWIHEGEMMWRTIADQFGIRRLDTGPPAQALEATADRGCGTLTVRCPHCADVNEFPVWSEIFSFLCYGCGGPVDVVERVHKDA
jgi:phage FluMu protein Com